MTSKKVLGKRNLLYTLFELEDGLYKGIVNIEIKLNSNDIYTTNIINYNPQTKQSEYELPFYCNTVGKFKLMVKKNEEDIKKFIREKTGKHLVRPGNEIMEVPNNIFFNMLTQVQQSNIQEVLDISKKNLTTHLIDFEIKNSKSGIKNFLPKELIELGNKYPTYISKRLSIK